MDAQKFLAWAQAASVLLAAGAATVQQIRDFVVSVHCDLTDAELNAICDAIISDAQRRKALAEADARPNG